MLPIALAAAVLSALLAFPAGGGAAGCAARALAEGTRLPDPPPGVPPDRRLGAALRLGWREWGSTLRVLLPRRLLLLLLHLPALQVDLAHLVPRVLRVGP